MTASKKNQLELYAYTGVFILSVIYSLLRFYQSSQEYVHEIDKSYYEIDCSFFLTCNRLKDVSDLEWQVIKQYLIQSKIVIFFMHSIGFYLTKKFVPWHLSTFVILYSSGCIIYLLSPFALFLYFAYIFAIISLEQLFNYLKIGCKSWIHYAIFIVSIYLIHDLQVFDDSHKNFLIQIGFSWLSSRCLSCALDIYKIKSELNNDKSLNISLSNLKIRMSYFLYLPPFFFGPMFHYEDFANNFIKLEQNDNFLADQNIFLKVLRLCRYIAWAWILEIIVHFFYTSSFQSYVYIIEDFDAWSICGFCFAISVLFFVKYAIFYGVSYSIAEIDGLRGVIALPPECIAHVNKNSYLWRKFDRGLYLFLFKYFYKPMIGSKIDSTVRRFVATFVVFSIIAVWHGFYKSVFIWIAINILISFAEIIGFEIRRSSRFGSIVNFLSPEARLRLFAIFGAPLLGFSYMSQIIFLSNSETGMVFLNRVMFHFPIPMLPTFFVLYCVYYVSDHINQKLENRK